MNILKRQLALLLVFAMILTMLPMPAHADEVTESESPSAIVEETAVKPMASNEEVSTDTANKSVENADSDTTAKETVAPAAETPVDSDTALTEELVADVSEDTLASVPVEEAEKVIETNDTSENADVEEETDEDSTFESQEDSSTADSDKSEEAEDSEADEQEETNQMESETDAPVFAAFSFRSSAANAASTDCDHSETEIAWDTKDQVINCKPISDTQHQISGYQYRYCTSCYERVGESFAATEMGNHELDADGDCSMCGYSSNSGTGSGSGSGGSDSGSDSNCEHENTAIGWDPDQQGPWYAQFNDTQHKVTGYRYTYCTDCHARIRDESGSNNNYYSEEVENHTLNASGECTLCGYGSTTECGHYNKDWSDSDDVSHYEQFDENTHYTYRFRYAACADCGEELEDTAYSIRNESHVPENGVCIHCNENVGEDYCAHSERDVAWDTKQTVTYNKFSNTHHKVTGYQYMYCTSCFDRVGESFAAEEYEEHSLNASGNCSLCGYASSENTGCAHKNTEEKFYHESPVRYAQFNEEEHYIYREGTIYCHDCRTDIGASDNELSSFEAHTLNDEGNCIYCGYGLGEDYCTHSNSKLVVDTDQPKVYYKKDENQHLVNFYQYHYCPSCSNRISESFLDATWEDHDFDASGACTLCGYGSDVGTDCIHENTETVTSTKLVNQSLTHHTVETTTYEECTTCHEKRNEVTDVEWVEHTPVDAESYGHEAAHPHKKYFICECGAHPYLEGQFHTANGEVQEESVCCICHGHKYGEEEDTSEGTRQKTCGNCGITTVTHTHEYELVQTTKLVIQSETHHTVETTTYEECISCHEKRNEATNKEWVEHTPMNKDAYGYEASHDNYHQKYFICECGAHPYIDGEYETANGKVQEKSVCCICNGHKYGEAAEAADGTWKKTCANCGLSQKVAAPVQPVEPEEEEEKHVHTYVLDKSNADEHPHTCIGTCFCEATIEYNSYSSSCCKCTGVHIWGDAIRLPDGSFKEVCSSCNASQTATPSSKVQNYYDVIDIILNRRDTATALKEMETGNFALWKEVSVEAAEKLTDEGFVFNTNFINALSDQKGTILDVVVIEEETWNQQQTKLWENLLIEMLHKQEDIMEDADAFSATLNETADWAGALEKTLELLNGEAKKNIEKEIIGIYNKIESIFVGLSKEDQMRLDELTSAREHVAKEGLKAKAIGNLMTAISVLTEGTSAKAIVDQQNRILADIQKGEEYKTILKDIYNTATAMGNVNLATAAVNVYNELNKDLENAILVWFEGVSEFIRITAENTFKEATEIGLDIALQKGAEAASAAMKKMSHGKYGTADVSFSFLEGLEIGATIAKYALGWDKVYQEAELLMTYNLMDANMDIVQVLQKEDAPYMLDLWGLLQAEGCNQAQVFLDVWENGDTLDETELGIEEGQIPAVSEALAKDRDYYIEELDLPLEKSK